MSRIKKFFLILMLTIIALFAIQVSSFALTQAEWDDVNWYIKQQTNNYGNLGSDPNTYMLNGKNIMAYKYKASTAVSKYTYTTVGVALHTIPTTDNIESFGYFEGSGIAYTPIYYTNQTTVGNKNYNGDVYEEKIGAATSTESWWVTYIDITSFVEANRGSGGTISAYYSKILAMCKNGEIVAGKSGKTAYVRFQDFLNDSCSDGITGKQRFQGGNSSFNIYQAAHDGYYNKPFSITVEPPTMDVTIHYIDESGNELMPATSETITSQKTYTFQPELWSNSRPYGFKYFYYIKNGNASTHSGYKYTNSQAIPDDGKVNDYDVYVVYGQTATFNIHYVKQGGHYNNASDRLLSSKINSNVALPKYLDFEVFFPDNRLMDKNAVKNIKLCNYAGNVDVNFANILISKGKEVNADNLIDELNLYLTSMSQLSDVWYNSSSRSMVLKINDYVYTNLVIEYAEADRATVNFHYIKEGGSINNTGDRLLYSNINEDIIVPSGILKGDVWAAIDPRDNILDGRQYNIKYINIYENGGTVLFSQSITQAGSVNKLFENAKDALGSRVEIQSTSSYPYIYYKINKDVNIDFVIEYEPVQNYINVSITYLYGTTEHPEGSPVCLKNTSQREGVLRATDNYQYVKGSYVTGINLLETIDHGDHTHTLVNSYFENADNGLEYHEGSSRTTRNPGTLTRDLSIIAEYSPCPGPVIPDNIPVYVYYIKEGANRNSLNSNNSKLISTDYYRVGDVVTKSLAENYTFSGQTLELKKSYIVNTNIGGTAEWVSSKNSSENTNGITSFVTTRNIRIQAYEPAIYIFAEYGEGEIVTTGGNTTYTPFTMGDTNNNARGLIASESNQYFNVYRGIPSGKNIYSQVMANEYLYTLSGYKVTGDRDYLVTVNVNFTFTWNCAGCACPGHSGSHSEGCSENCSSDHTYTDDCDGICNGHSGTGSSSYDYIINRTFKFYTIGSYEVYKINTAFIRNALLNGNNIGYSLWNGNNVTVSKTIDPDFDDHVKFHYDDFKKSISVNATRALSETPAKGGTPTYPYSSYSSDFLTDADGAIEPIEVMSDALTIDGETIIPGNEWLSTNATDPNFSKQVSTDKEFIEKNIKIPVMQENGHYKTTENKIRYVSQEAFGQEKSNDILTNIDGYYETSAIYNYIEIEDSPTRDDKVNDVAVHTPVYVDMDILSVDELNKETAKSTQDNHAISGEDQATVVLDKSFTIHFDVRGNNDEELRQIKAYDNVEDYLYDEYITPHKYLKEVPEIKFPFDVYVETSGDNTMLCKANTWYKVTQFDCGYTDERDENGYLKCETGDITVIVPVWTEETTYYDGIVMRVIAYNDQVPANRTSIGAYEEGNWNKEYPYPNDNSSVEGTVRYDGDTKYSRTCDKITIKVTGRVYDFKVTYTDEPNYKNEFLNGNFRDRIIANLPLGQGNHKFYEKQGNNWVVVDERPDNITNTYATALRLGSKIRYDLKTKGKASSNIKIVPTYYWVSKNGGTLQEVDAYYRDTNGKRVKLTTETGLAENITVQNTNEIPNANNRNLLTVEIGNTKNYLPYRVGAAHNYSSVTYIGKTGKVLLGSTERLAYNILTKAYAENYGSNQTTATVENDAGGLANILASNSHWYGEFTLPENAWFVTKDGSVNNKEQLKSDDNGYVVVYFNIETLNGAGTDYLSYQKSNIETQWGKEGYNINKKIVLPNGITIDDISKDKQYAAIAIYDANVNKNGSSVIITH